MRRAVCVTGVRYTATGADWPLIEIDRDLAAGGAIMNSIMRDKYPTFELYQALRDELMDLLTDTDLAFQVSEANPSLGALCREIGETERSYIESFHTFAQDFSYRNPDLALEHSLDMLKSWYAELDRDLRAAVERLADEDIATKTIDRGGGFRLPPNVQLVFYQEALLIFYGKVSVYLKALCRALPEQWQVWIG
jgi:hypothetical protein